MKCNLIVPKTNMKSGIKTIATVARMFYFSVIDFFKVSLKFDLLTYNAGNL